MARKSKTNNQKPERVNPDARRLQIYRVIFVVISVILVLSMVLSSLTNI